MKNTTTIIEETYKQRIESVIEEWNKINSVSDWNKWADVVCDERFGTYGTIPIFEVIKNTNIVFATSWNKCSFENELKDALSGFRHR